MTAIAITTVIITRDYRAGGEQHYPDLRAQKKSSSIIMADGNIAAGNNNSDNYLE